MYNAIDLQTFNQQVPAFTAPDDKIFNLCLPAIQSAAMELEALVPNPAWLEADGAPVMAERIVCLSGAVRTVPHLDLVLTPTGFGVVSNQNVAPASRERVSALVDQMKEDLSFSEDLLLLKLLPGGWGSSAPAARKVDTLLWCPLMLRRQGITCQGRTVHTREQYEALRPAILAAHRAACDLVSPGLMEALVDEHRTQGDRPPLDLRGIAEERARGFMAAHILREAYPRALQPAARQLLSFVQQHPEAFPEYAGSSEMQSGEIRYQNKKTDGTFFFGC